MEGISEISQIKKQHGKGKLLYEEARMVLQKQLITYY